MGMKQEDDLVFLEVTDPSDTFSAPAPSGSPVELIVAGMMV